MKNIKKLLSSCLIIVCFGAIVVAQSSSKAIRKADQARGKGDIRGAIAVLDKAVKKKENLFEIYRMRAILHEMLGQTQNVFDDATSALELKPGEGELYHMRAMSRMFLRHDPGSVLEDLDLAIANGFRVEKVYATRAGFRRMIRDLDGALADYQTAVGLNPESAGSNVGLASVYRQMDDEAQAISVLENFLSKYESNLEERPVVTGRVVAKTDAIVLKDDDAQIVAGSDSILIIQDDPPDGSTREGLQEMSYQLEQKKNTAFAYSELAALYAKQGEYEKALDFVGKGIAMDPTDKEMVGVRGKIKAGMKDYDGALEDLSAAIVATPTFPNHYLERGIVLLMLNRDDEAQKDFDRFTSIIPFPAARENMEKRIAKAKQERIEGN